jgi:hypothetical protein
MPVTAMEIFPGSFLASAMSCGSVVMPSEESRRALAPM